MEGKRNYVARFSSLLVSCAILSACYAPIVAPTQSEVVEMPLKTEEPSLESTVTPTTSPTRSPTPSKPDVVSYSDVFDACNGAEKVNLQPGFTFGQLVAVGHECYGNIAPDIDLQEGVLSHLMRYNIFDGETMPDEDTVIEKNMDLYMEKSPENMGLLGFKLVNLSGKVFFDYNGSGEQENGEPEIEDVRLCIDNYGSDLCAFTGLNGNYSIEGILDGKHDVLIESPTDEPESAFRYINISHGWVDIPAYEIDGVEVPAQHLPDTEILSIKQPLKVTFDENQNLDIALMQGFLSERPYDEERVEHEPFITSLTDLDLDLGSIEDALGNSSQTIIYDHNTWNAVKPGTMDQHQGTDWAMPVGTEIKLLAPGWITNSEGGPQDGYARYVRQVVDIEGDQFVYLITYGHNSENLITVSKKILPRGKIIAKSGRSGSDGRDTTNPHLHISVWAVPRKFWEKYEDSSLLYDYLFGRKQFLDNGNSVIYPNGKNVAKDYCPFKHELFINGLDWISEN
jgi:murein DD-endopeptidase MepM/ murein hydrolase activator NlpD